MTVKDLEELYEYGYWANRKLFAVIGQLKADEFTRSVAGSYGSIRNTLVHALSAEWGWLERCGGHARGPKLNADDYPTTQSIIEQWANVEGYVREFFSTLTDEDLSRIAKFQSDRGEIRSLPLGELMQHGALHGIHHRGQVALLLRALGYTPGYIDMLVYLVERRNVPA